MKLELKHLAPYLPYSLKAIKGVTRIEITAVSLELPHIYHTSYLGSRLRVVSIIEEIKPILRPLSDLTEKIKLFGSGQEISIINYLNIANSKTWKWKPRLKTLVLEDYGRGSVSYNLLSSGYLYLPHSIVTLLFENNFDVFGLIDAGLAIDINTLESKV